MTREISCSEMKQITFTWKLESDSNHRALKAGIRLQSSCIESWNQTPIIVHWKLESDTNHRALKAGIRLQSSCIPPVNTASHCDQTENLWGNRRGLELSADLSIVSKQTGTCTNVVERRNVELCQSWTSVEGQTRPMVLKDELDETVGLRS